MTKEQLARLSQIEWLKYLTLNNKKEGEEYEIKPAEDYIENNDAVKSYFERISNATDTDDIWDTINALIALELVKEILTKKFKRLL